jgi:hypothetical protein
MTPEEYNNKINNVINELQGGSHADLLIQIANNANAMIKRRVQESGETPSGGKYRDYSKWYKEYKQATGKYKGYTDFSYTNRMWTNIQVVQERSDVTKAIISTRDKGQAGYDKNIQVKVKEHKRKDSVIKAYNYNKMVHIPTNYEKLEKNTESFGPILDLSKEEVKLLKKNYDNGILDIFRRNGL